MAVDMVNDQQKQLMSLVQYSHSNSNSEVVQLLWRLIMAAGMVPRVALALPLFKDKFTEEEAQLV